MVAVMVAGGIVQADIARALDLDEKTLRKHYGAEIDRGAAVANTKVVANLFRIATGQGREAVTAAIWWTKCRMGWSEYRAVQPPGPQPPPKEPRKGKKELANEAALDGHEGTTWGSVLPN